MCRSATRATPDRSTCSVVTVYSNTSEPPGQESRRAIVTEIPHPECVDLVGDHVRTTALLFFLAADCMCAYGMTEVVT